MGKGSNSRPFSVSQKQFGTNFDAIFRKNSNENDETPAGAVEHTGTDDSGSSRSASTDSREPRGTAQDDITTTTTNTGPA